jgi:DNA-binding NtrC family response regulator
MPATLEREGVASFVTRVVRETATILVADDDVTLLQVTAMILKRSGYKVLTACGGEEALKGFEESQHPIHLVISDVVMPGMKGPELIRSIKSLSPSTAALLMSGTRSFVSDEGVALIVKPFTRKALSEKVRDILAGCNFVQIKQEQLLARAQRLIAPLQWHNLKPAGDSLRSSAMPHVQELPEDSEGKE